MNRIMLDQDIHSVSEFRANTTRFIQQVKSTRRPLVLTQHGKSSAILLDVEEYENLLDRIELSEDIRSARQELKNGMGIPSGEARRLLMGKFK